MSYYFESIDDFDEYAWNDFQDYVNQLKYDDVMEMDYETKYALEMDHAFRKEILLERNKHNEFNQKSAIDEFVGIIDGISFDGIINHLEIDTLKKWLSKNYKVLDNTKYRAFLQTVEETINDVSSMIL